MAYDTNCTPPVETFDELSTVLKALVASDPTSYQLEDKGPCGCCPSACVCYDCSIMPVLWVTFTAVGHCTYSADNSIDGTVWEMPCTGGFTPTWQVTPAPSPIPCGGDSPFILVSCVSSNPDNMSYLLQIWDGCGSPGGSTTFTVVACSDPSCFDVIATYPNCVFYAGVLKVRLTSFDPRLPTPIGCTPPTPPNPWWRVETNTYPYCACQQGVTEAVGGPYTTQSLCLATCTPVEWCCEYQDYDTLGNKKGNPYNGCITGNFIIGQLTTESGGNSGHRVARRSRPDRRDDRADSVHQDRRPEPVQGQEVGPKQGRQLGPAPRFQYSKRRLAVPPRY